MVVLIKSNEMIFQNFNIFRHFTVDQSTSKYSHDYYLTLTLFIFFLSWQSNDHPCSPSWLTVVSRKSSVFIHVSWLTLSIHDPLTDLSRRGFQFELRNRIGHVILLIRQNLQKGQSRRSGSYGSFFWRIHLNWTLESAKNHHELSLWTEKDLSLGFEGLF